MPPPSKSTFTMRAEMPPQPVEIPKIEVPEVILPPETPAATPGLSPASTWFPGAFSTSSDSDSEAEANTPSEDESEVDAWVDAEDWLGQGEDPLAKDTTGTTDVSPSGESLNQSAAFSDVDLLAAPVAINDAPLDTDDELSEYLFNNTSDGAESEKAEEEDPVVLVIQPPPATIVPLIPVVSATPFPLPFPLIPLNNAASVHPEDHHSNAEPVGPVLQPDTVAEPVNELPLPFIALPTVPLLDLNAETMDTAWMMQHAGLEEAPAEPHQVLLPCMSSYRTLTNVLPATDCRPDPCRQSRR
jgi:hypothetical protein